MLGEYLRGLPGFDKDYRGAIYQDEATNSQLYTKDTPNSSVPDRIWTGYCINRPELNLPCTDDYNESGTARSRHPGGVMVALCDGSARFMNDDISLVTWQALGTIKNSEVVGDY